MKPKFVTCKIADISTRHITAEDGKRIGNPEAPGHLASVVDRLDTNSEPTGDIFTVLKDPASHAQQMQGLKEYGFSDAFLAIIEALYTQKIPYVRFDRDGEEVEGLPEFDW